MNYYNYILNFQTKPVTVFSYFRRSQGTEAVNCAINARNMNSLLIFYSSKTYQLLLLTWSPNPGVSVIVSLNRTPFSSMTARKTKREG